MTPKAIDIHIICAKCNKPVERRQMIHDVPAGLYRYSVECHGAKDFGDHLTTAASTDLSEALTLKAFP